ncbi:MAG: prepilin-type N-terminal cleavage/methylation domain-containing protein [Planctomycetes bacterium]|nr:prepilin-type N-terminal cleavage/methylation domain-containing protein [Planctomycetota bacterium]MCB9935139.1 prepilin-type N-terminal cleavage/methylation domain-containing protein [Planctomycetota bacterium]
MRKRTNNRKGFTLTEILVALAIFALGGTAIMALFITNLRLSRQAMDYTRAAEITRNIRSLMTQSLARPISVSETDTIYAFYYPESSLTFTTDKYREFYEGGKDRTSSRDRDARNDIVGGAPAANTVFFRLPKVMFDAGVSGDGRRQMVTEMPTDGLNSSGGQASFEGEPRVFRLMPDPLRRAGAIEDLDPDDRMGYQFDFSVRRSVQRSSVDAADGSGRKQPLDDLYVVHVKIYKGFEFEGNVINDPFFEWDFYVNAAK